MEPSGKTEVLAKPWYESKVLWVNALGLVILIVGIILDSASVLELSGEMVAWLGVALAVANAMLRFVTSAPLASGSGQTAVVEAPRVFTEQAAAPPMPHVDIPPGGGRG